MGKVRPRKVKKLAPHKPGARLRFVFDNSPTVSRCVHSWCFIRASCSRAGILLSWFNRGWLSSGKRGDAGSDLNGCHLPGQAPFFLPPHLPVRPRAWMNEHSLLFASNHPHHPLLLSPLEEDSHPCTLAPCIHSWILDSTRPSRLREILLFP